MQEAHARRLKTVEGGDWWFVIEEEGEPVGVIGIWPHETEGQTDHEVGWMVVPERQGEGIATRALAMMLDRARSDGRFPVIHAFPGASNKPSNALCARAGFELVGSEEVTLQGRPVHVQPMDAQALMYDHVGIRGSDREASDRFYLTVLETIDVDLTHRGDAFSEWDDFATGQASEERPVTRNLHVGFVSPSREHVDEFWRVGTEAGYESDGEPGPRTEYGDDYYGSFLLDPDGNSVEAVHHGDLRRGNVDHLWIGVSDLDAAALPSTARSRGSWASAEGTTSSERQQFRGAWGTFSLLADGRPPTENLHMAFPVPDRDDVHRFHEAAIAAGLPRQRRAGRAARVPPRLLRRLRPRP